MSPTLNEYICPVDVQEEGLGPMLQSLEEKFLTPEWWWENGIKSRPGVSALEARGQGVIIATE